MKTSQVLGAMMGAALLSGAAFAEPNGPQCPGPRGDGPGVRPPCEGQGCAGMMQGCPGQEGRPGMMQGRRPEGMGGNPGMQRGGPGREGGQGMHPSPEMLKQAGAKEEQLQALAAFQFEQQTKRIDLQAAADKAELALGQQMKGTAVDEKAALKAADALTQARGELFKLEIASQIKTRQILGEEVLKKMHEMAASRSPDRPGRGPGTAGPRPDAPPPPAEKAPAPEQK